MATIGVDIGGTKVFAALVDEGGSIVQRSSSATDPEAGTASIISAIHTLLETDGPRPSGPERPGAVGVAAAAWVEYPSGQVAFAPNLIYEEPDLVGTLSAAVGLPVVVENDASAAAWAEQQYGAARGATEMIMVTVGTGIGGGAVIDGRLLRGAHGFAGEFGHLTLVDGGPLCGCGQRGCLEALASGTAIGRMAQEGIDGAPDTILLELAADDRRRITGALVSEAAHAGDEFAAEVLARAGRWLGAGLASLVQAFDPEVVVVGGGGAAAGWFLLEPARIEMDRRLARRVSRPPIREATLGNDAGAIGAASLARLRTAGG
ncbi:MAG TPA: ROK family protein [Actinomycetota bacterium]|nr:ROK family protein [Actinomycetota bacterium]